MMAKLKHADCTKRADRPMVNIRNRSSVHKMWNVFCIEPKRWTYNIKSKIQERKCMQI